MKDSCVYGTARILHLEDSDLDAELIRARLAASDLPHTLDRARDRGEFLHYLTSVSHDLILSDYQLPTLDGYAALDLAQTWQPEVPFVFVSGVLGEEVAIDTLKRGATDYVLKQRLARLLPAAERALAEAREKAERKRAEADLARVTAAAERRRLIYEAALSNTPDLVYVFDLEGRFAYANEALLALWGKTWDEAAGKTCLELGYEPWHAEMHEREIAQVIATRRPIRGEVPFTGTTGRRIYDYIFVPVFGPDGAVVAVTGTTRDVTDRKKAEEDLRAADRRKDEFLATLAHELRNPLAPIRNGLHIIRAADDRSTRQRAWEVMERQVRQLIRLVDDLLDVSRIATGKLRLKPERTDLAAAMAAAVETARPVVEVGGHTLTVRWPDPPVALDADPTRLAQVFQNLLTNAAKYSEPGGKITFAGRRDGDKAVVTVSDTGIGIAADMLPTIFEPFTQIDRSLEKTQGGLGIGLSLVRRLVELHGGTVEARSDGHGKGSEFVVRLPLPREAPPSPAALPAERNGTHPKRRRVLVVDDNQDSAESLQMLLSLQGNEVRVAHDGLMGLAEAEAFKPDVVFLDIGMPGLNGYDAARRLRAHPELKRITLVALTGWGQDEDRRRTREAGFDHHLVKPAEIAMLQAILAAK